VNNVPYPIKGLQLDFDSDIKLLPYYLLYCSLGTAGQDQGLTFDREEFCSGQTFFGFDINQSTGSDSALQLEKKGCVRIELKFA